MPQAITELLAIPRLGPKRVRALQHELGIRTLAQLLDAARAGRVSELQGFGPKMERQILEDGALRESRRRRSAAQGQDKPELLIREPLGHGARPLSSEITRAAAAP